jgi:hypothetical protein
LARHTSWPSRFKGKGISTVISTDSNILGSTIAKIKLTANKRQSEMTFENKPNNIKRNNRKTRQACFFFD